MRANVPYSDVKEEPAWRRIKLLCMRIKNLTRWSIESAERKSELTGQCHTDLEFPVSQPAAPVYDTAGEVTETSQQQLVDRNCKCIQQDTYTACQQHVYRNCNVTVDQ